MKAALKKVIMCFYSINKFVFKLQQDINYEWHGYKQSCLALSEGFA